METLRTTFVGTLLTAPLVVDDETPLTKVIGILCEKNAYEVYLVQGGRVGCVTTRDLLKATNIEKEKASTIAINLPVLGQESSLSEAARLISDYRLRSVPVAEDGKFLGAVSSLSIIGRLEHHISGRVKIASMMTPQPVTVSPQTSVAKARDLMVRRRIDHLPVTTDRKIAGMVTSLDVLATWKPPERVSASSRVPDMMRRLEFPVESLMNREPLTCSPEEEASAVLAKMTSRGGTYALVVLWEELQGIVTHRDFMTLLIPSAEKSEVPVFMIGLPDDPFEANAAKIKFERTVTLLRRSFPTILEARSIIKVKSAFKEKERRRYEVDVVIKTTKQRYAYTETGYDLPAIYDALADRMKRLMAQKPTRRTQRER